MITLRKFVGPVLLMLTSLGAAQAAENKVLVPGDPSLTQDMVDDYGKFLQWRFGPAVAGLGGPERLREMIVNDWKNGDLKRRLAFVSDLKWWREEFPKLSKEDRERLAGKGPVTTQDLERLRQSSVVEMIHKLQLQQAYDARMQQILAISQIRAAAHEVNMQIIRNIGPTGRYEYNPATGRYDRYVPYR